MSYLFYFLPARVDCVMANCNRRPAMAPNKRSHFVVAAAASMSPSSSSGAPPVEGPGGSGEESARKAVKRFGSERSRPTQRPLSSSSPLSSRPSSLPPSPPLHFLAPCPRRPPILLPWMHLPWLFLLLLLLLLMSRPLSQQLDPAAPSEATVPLRPQPDEQQTAAIESVVSEIKTHCPGGSPVLQIKLKSLPATDLGVLVNVMQEISRRRDYLSKSCLSNLITFDLRRLYERFDNALQLDAVSTFHFLTCILPEMTIPGPDSSCAAPVLRQALAALLAIRDVLVDYASFHKWLNEELLERGYSEEQCRIIARRVVKLPPSITAWAFQPFMADHRLAERVERRERLRQRSRRRGGRRSSEACIRAVSGLQHLRKSHCSAFPSVKDAAFETLLNANDDTCCIEDLAKLPFFGEHISKGFKDARDKDFRMSEEVRQLVNQMFPQACLPPRLEADWLPPVRKSQFQDSVKESWFTCLLHRLRVEYGAWLLGLTKECLHTEKLYNTWICNVKTAIRDSRSLIPGFGSHREFKTVETSIANANANWTEEIIPYYRIKAEHNESRGIPEKLKGLLVTWEKVFEQPKGIVNYVKRIPQHLGNLVPESAGDKEPIFASDLHRFRTLLLSSSQEPFNGMDSILREMDSQFPYIFISIRQNQENQNNMQQNQQRAIEGFNDALKITGGATLLVASFLLTIVGVLCWWRNRTTNMRLCIRKV